MNRTLKLDTQILDQAKSYDIMGFLEHQDLSLCKSYLVKEFQKLNDNSRNGVEPTSLESDLSRTKSVFEQTNKEIVQ